MSTEQRFAVLRGVGRKPSINFTSYASSYKVMKASKKWWEKGLHFECQGSGKCCAFRGEQGFVYLTPSDEKRMAKHLKLSVPKFRKLHCNQTDGLWHLKGEDGDCIFLKDKRCGVYEARPIQCRTWPFWPENMKAKTWSKEIASFCPGIGKGRLWTKDEIQAQLDLQEEADEADSVLLTPLN